MLPSPAPRAPRTQLNPPSPPAGMLAPPAHPPARRARSTALIELPYGHVEMTARGCEPENIRPVVEWFQTHLVPAKEA
eukprot:199809-Chlamydomonas_euryale.AAC.1